MQPIFSIALAGLDLTEIVQLLWPMLGYRSA